VEDVTFIEAAGAMIFRKDTPWKRQIYLSFSTHVRSGLEKEFVNESFNTCMRKDEHDFSFFCLGSTTHRSQLLLG
jgi:hypothetical protein